MSDLLTVPQVAAILQCTPAWVRDELRRKNLRGSQFANRGSWRIRRADLDTYIEAHANVSPVRRASA